MIRSKKTIGLIIIAVGIALGAIYLSYPSSRPLPAAGTPPSAANWTHYGKDRDGDHFYKTHTSGETSTGIVSVWEQIVFSPEGKEQYIQKRQKFGFKTEGYDRLSHRSVLYELNCFSKKREYSTQEVFELTREGKTLDYARAGTYKDWQDVPPDSVLDQLCTIVCPERR